MDDPPASDIMEVKKTPAQETTDLARERNVLAAARTLLAWIRTSLALIGFGFSLFKFLYYVRGLSGTTDLHISGTRNFGLTLIGLGTVLLVAAAWEYWRLIQRLSAGQDKARERLPILAAAAVAIIGVIAFLGVILNTGHF